MNHILSIWPTGHVHSSTAYVDIGHFCGLAEAQGYESISLQSSQEYEMSGHLCVLTWNEPLYSRNHSYGLTLTSEFVTDEYPVKFSFVSNVR